MPPKQKNATPSKPPEGPTMTHEEEERQYDISNLKSQVDNMVLSQRATDVKIEGLKADMKA